MLLTGFSLTLTPKWRIGLRRFDERAADVVIADEAEAKRNVRLFRIADGGADTGVGNRHDHVGRNAGLSRQGASESSSGLR